MVIVKVKNSLGKGEFILDSDKQHTVNMYTCGVTVYDDCHIGHARSLYIFDVIRRYLKYRGFKVNFVRNITDIDDKIINRANELGIDWKELIEKYIARYNEDLTSLGIEKGILDGADEPRATENIQDIIKYIEALIEKDFAYETDTGVYFSVRKFTDYGKLSHQSIEQMLTGVRKSHDETKKDPLDFALWKKAKENEPFWPSPWGDGRPGWHIECSVMSQKYLKTDTLDIHAGGRDLIFPHHENEIAQAEAKTEKPFAKCWIHHGLLTINAQKMSKSSGNFITIKDFLARYKNMDLLKLFFLSAHYSQSIDYSDKKIEEVKESYKSIVILRDKLIKHFGTVDLAKVVKQGTGNMMLFKDKFIEYMDNDFSMPRALSVLFDMVHNCNKLLDSDDEFKPFILHYALDVMNEMTEIFGLKFLEIETLDITKEEIDRQINLRLDFKKQKKFTEADRIREALDKKGIVIEDTREGSTWRKKI
ncbi:MAG: cysteine--tRNA ligase [Candidatus Gygaella obscura]|nr:cysteine--tRNA ligase [Candidatus Gygaella obscura]